MPHPLLSITMPTRNRAELLERALRSVVRAVAPVAEHIEVAVSDGSDDDATGAVVGRVLTGWPGGHRYVWNRPALTLVENMNRAVEISTGQWVMQLDDDDYLLPGAGQAMLDAIRRAGPDESGAAVRGPHRGRRRRAPAGAAFRRERYLEPKEALRRLLRNSSFVREPTAVVRRAALERGGPVRHHRRRRHRHRHVGAAVLPLRRAVPAPGDLCVHHPRGGGDDRHVESRAPSGRTREIFDRAVAQGVVPERTIRRWQADWYHQFILAGAYRRLRMGRRAEAREVLRLFDLPEVRDRGVSPSGCRCGSRSRPHSRGAAKAELTANGAHSTRSSQISRQYG